MDLECVCLSRFSELVAPNIHLAQRNDTKGGREDVLTATAVRVPRIEYLHTESHLTTTYMITVAGHSVIDWIKSAQGD